MTIAFILIAIIALVLIVHIVGEQGRQQNLIDSMWTDVEVYQPRTPWSGDNRHHIAALFPFIDMDDIDRILDSQMSMIRTYEIALMTSPELEAEQADLQRVERDATLAKNLCSKYHLQKDEIWCEKVSLAAFRRRHDIHREIIRREKFVEEALGEPVEMAK